MSIDRIIEWLLVGGTGAAIVKMAESLMSQKICWKAEKQKTIERAISDIQESLDVLKKSQLVMLHDKLRYLSKKHKVAGSILYEDRKDLADMYKAYSNLGGNGNISSLIKAVMELPLS